MEVKIKIDLSDKNQREALNLLFDAIAGTVEKPSKQEAPKQEAPKQEAPKQEAPKQEAPKQEVESKYTIDDVRNIIGEKAKVDREAVKNKLNELGAKNATGLAKEHYDEFVEYLKTL